MLFCMWFFKVMIFGRDVLIKGIVLFNFLYFIISFYLCVVVLSIGYIMEFKGEIVGIRFFFFVK